jgi:hypothetical protein
VLAAARAWAQELYARDPAVSRVGYFGSYARGNAGVGSDLDLVVITRGDSSSRRAGAFDASRLPVPADVLVYSEARWNELRARHSGIARTIAREAKWFERDER